MSKFHKDIDGQLTPMVNALWESMLYSYTISDDQGIYFRSTAQAALDLSDEMIRLDQVNAELLAALKAIELALKLPTVTPAQVLHESSVIRQGIRAAITKAEGK